MTSIVVKITLLYAPNSHLYIYLLKNIVFALSKIVLQLVIICNIHTFSPLAGNFYRKVTSSLHHSLVEVIYNKTALWRLLYFNVNTHISNMKECLVVSSVVY